METDTPAQDKKKWFAARTGHGQELGVRSRLEKLGIEHFIPTRTVIRTLKGRKTKREVALIPNLIFLRETHSGACSAVNSDYLNVRYIMDRASNSMLVVPDKQMEDFIRVVSDDYNRICPPESNFVPGGRVRVVCGSFAGVEGEVVKLPNRTYVLVSLGQLICAKVQIPRSYLKSI